MARRRYTPRLKAQVVLEVLGGEKTPGQVAKAYGVRSRRLPRRTRSTGTGGPPPNSGRRTATG
ncbi:hypothetical protein [Candidatus Palauibacter sp.]|uniref:hypothetical protein n=1 Tax=Candidatus Palauibacter sp. TaxID=3101350 RepID=UPI003B52B5DC